MFFIATQLSGCAASWTTFDIYAPYDARQVADAEVSVVRPVVTTRPDAPGDPWGDLATRFQATILEEVDGPFLSAAAVGADALPWSPDSWSVVDDATNSLLAHSPNPFPRGEHGLEEGLQDAPDSEIGVDGYVLLVAVQPSMKETLARLMGAAGEVTRFEGFSRHLDEAMGDAKAPEVSHHDTVDPDQQAKPGPGEPTTPAKAAKERRTTMLGKQNRVDVAFLLIDRRTGRFVAAQSTRMEPVTSPSGSYRGAIRRALRDWRLAEEPATLEMFIP